MSLGGETMMTMPVAPAGNYGGGFGGWGNDWWILLLFLLWGNNGWGGGGMNGGVGAEVQRGFDTSAIINKLDGITQGICDSTYALNNAVNNGFHGVDRGLCDLQGRISDCCCTTQRAIDGVNYNLATQSCDTRNLIQSSTRDLMENANANSRAILDFLTQDKIQTLRDENTSLKFQASQSAQNGFIDAVVNSAIVQLRQPTPVPAYQVPAPYPYCGSGYNSGCGCGCGY